MKENEKEYRWCLVGNIIDRRFYGENHEIRYGTKNFSSGTKVYIAPHQWGDGGEQLVVFGNPRHKKGYIECVIERDFICNFRAVRIYSPLLLKRIKNSKYSWWTNDDKEFIEKIAKELNDFNKDNKKVIYNETKEEFLSSLSRLHTTELGEERIKNNLNLDTNDVIEYCKNKLKDKNAKIYREGKNWYCETDNIRITINACSYTIITVHIINN